MSESFSGKQLTDFITTDPNQYIKQYSGNSRYEVSFFTMLFTNMWLFAHGIASLLVTNNLLISKEIRNMMSEVLSTNNKYSGGKIE